MFIEILILLLLILFSALFSASEIVFVVVNQLKVELKAQQGSFSAKKAITFLNNPKEFFITCLVGNNIVNITFSSLFTIFINKIFNIDPVYILFLTAGTLLIFGEIIPKVYSREYAERFIYPLTVFVILGKMIFAPIITLMNFITSKTFDLIDISVNSKKLNYTKEDLYNLIESQDVNVKESEEFFYFLKSMDIIDKKVKEIMIPRIEITAVEKNILKSDLISQFSQKNNFIILVYQDTIDNIIGYLKIVDLLKESSEIEELISPVLYVPETITCSELIEKFQKEKTYVAVIIDEFGGTAGLITLNSLLYEIIGKANEDAIQGKIFKQISENSYILQGRVELNYINEILNLNIKSIEAITLSGYIIEHHGKVPKSGEIIRIGKCTFKILKSNQLRIDLVEMSIEQDQ